MEEVYTDEGDEFENTKSELKSKVKLNHGENFCGGYSAGSAEIGSFSDLNG